MRSYPAYVLALYLCFGFFASVGTSFAQTGPGGVGNTSGSSTLRIWVRADLGVALNSNSVSQWSDQSGYGNHLTMATVVNQPSFATNVFNGYPTVRYIGSNFNYFNSGFSGPGTNGITIFLFARGTSYQSLIRYQNNSGTYLVYPWELGAGRPFITSSDGGTGSGLSTGLNNNIKNIGTGRYQRNVATTGFQTFLNGTLVGQRTSANNVLPTQAFFSGRYNPGASEYPTADVPEMIIYYGAVNEAQRMIVENYLAAKYDTLLTSNDLYTMDNSANGNYDHDVAGIGQASDGSNHTNSRGTGVVQVSNPGGLANNEFFFWGKNNIATGVVTTVNMPSAAPQNVQARWAAEWRVSETGDVGTTDISFDLSSLASVNASHLRLLIDTDNDGLFSDELNGTGVISGASSLGGGVYQFSGVNISNASRFTLGTINAGVTPLPIELISFTGFAENKEVYLKWITASEKNNKRFEVYRSQDGSNWKYIGTREGNLSTNDRSHYEFTDKEPIAGLNYYKLEDVDLHDIRKTSDIISVQVSGGYEAKVFPNPGDGRMIQLEFSRAVQFEEIGMIDALGLKVPINWTYAKDNVISVLPQSKLSPGVYLLRYRFSDGAFRQKKVQITGYTGR